MAESPVIVIAAADALSALKKLPGVGQRILVFADADSLRAEEAVAQHRPNLIVLQWEFLGTPRGAMLIARIRGDPALRHAQIRVLADINEYIHLVSRRAKAGLEPGEAMPGEPLPPDYDGGRGTHRCRMRPGVEVRLDGDPTTLVNLSSSGAQLLVQKALRLNQQVRISIEDEQEMCRFRASVIWVSFERSTETGSQLYRAGLTFIDAHPELVEAMCSRNRQ